MSISSIPGRVEIREGAHPWQHVRAIGEDVIATEMVFPENHKITPYDIGALLAAGYQEVNVQKETQSAHSPNGIRIARTRPRLCRQAGFGLRDHRIQFLCSQRVDRGGRRSPCPEPHRQR